MYHVRDIPNSAVVLQFDIDSSIAVKAKNFALRYDAVKCAVTMLFNSQIRSGS